jgi:hypothetical protein
VTAGAGLAAEAEDLVVAEEVVLADSEAAAAAAAVPEEVGKLSLKPKAQSPKPVQQF